MASSGLHSSENYGGSRNSASIFSTELSNKAYIINDMNLVLAKDERPITLNKSDSILKHNVSTLKQTISRIQGVQLPETAIAQNGLLDPM
tara:strand:+ start:126 stop:395 length:270 start_codon:yes stop_codon:yes gene_type:complete